MAVDTILIQYFVGHNVKFANKNDMINSVKHLRQV